MVRDTILLDARLSKDKLDFSGDNHLKYVIYRKIDQYLHSYGQGLASLPFCLLEFLHASKTGDKPRYDLIIYLDRMYGECTTVVWENADVPSWLKDYQDDYQAAVSGQSRSPHRKGSGGRNQLQDLMGASQPESNAQTQATQQQGAQPNLASAEENILGEVESVIYNVSRNHGNVAIVYHSPDTLFSDPAPDAVARRRKLQKIRAWQKYSNCDCFLIISSQKCAEDFRAEFENIPGFNPPLALEIESASREVFMAFCERLLCLNREGLRCNDLETIALTAQARELSLMGFLEDIRARYSRFRVQEEHQGRPFVLDDMYEDRDKVRTANELLAEINGLVGLRKVKEIAQNWFDQVSKNSNRRSNGNALVPVEVRHMMFVGDPGTGKTEVANLLGKLLMALGLRKCQTVTTITYSDISSAYNHGEMISKMTHYVEKVIAERGVLFIDEAYRFADSTWGKQAFEVLIDKMDKFRHEFTLILAGYKDRCQALYRINQGLKSRIDEVEFPPYSEDDIFRILQYFFDRSKVCELPQEGEVPERLRQSMQSLYRRGLCCNGREARKLFGRVEDNVKSRMSTESGRELVKVADIPAPMKVDKGKADEWLKHFESDFLGLSKVKAFMHDLYVQCEKRDERLEAPDYDMAKEKTKFFNCFFVGGPGTGKTSVAKRMATYYKCLGITASDEQPLEVGLSEMASAYDSEFSTLVRNKFEEAKGRILFIDEAYTLTQTSQGQSILNEIVKNITLKEFSDVFVVMAGYEDDMNALYKLNPGLQRRMPYKVVFDNFTGKELVDIFWRNLMRQKRYTVPVENEPQFRQRLKTLLERQSQQRNFGNAGAVEEFYERVENACDRREKATGEPRRYELALEDLSPEVTDARETPETVIAEMRRRFVGIERFIDYLETQHRKQEHSRLRAEILGCPEPEETHNIHNMIIRGPAGCGKTALVPYLARLFAAWGYISHRTPRIIRGQELTGEYLGQTKKRVLDEFENAQDRLLFIDEAYALYQGRSTDQYGQEAIDALVGCMTDPKNLSTIVVMAGYPDRMATMLDRNPGLKRRLPNSYEIPPFDSETLALIVMRNLEEGGYDWEDEQAKAHYFDLLKRRFDILMQLDDTGNADAAIQLFRQICRYHDAELDWDVYRKLVQSGQTLTEQEMRVMRVLEPELPPIAKEDYVRIILRQTGRDGQMRETLRGILMEMLPDELSLAIVRELCPALKKQLSGKEMLTQSQARDLMNWMRDFLEAEKA